MFYYYDATYLLVIVGALLCTFASLYVNSSMNKYHHVRNMSGLTGAEAAERILRSQGLYDVRIECITHGGDHYDPRSKTVRLSRENYASASVTAVAVAAHECGHAKQHEESYLPLTLRSVLVPVVNIGSKLGIPLILLGVLLSWNMVLIQIGILAFSLAVLFQLVTLPVEFNASRRAISSMENVGILAAGEIGGAKNVLRAAALTYVAATASSILQLLRLVLLFGGGNKRNRR